MIRILRVVINSLLFGILWIEEFFFSWSLHWIPTLRRLIAEFLVTGGGVALIKWALSLKVELLKDLISTAIIVAVIEIRRMLQRARWSYDSIKEYLPLKEAYKRFIARPIREHLLQRSAQERINAAK